MSADAGQRLRIGASKHAPAAIPPKIAEIIC
jgi:hypothetical protein